MVFAFWRRFILRLLVVPAVLIRNLSGDSYAYWMKNVIEQLVTKDSSKHWVYMLFPKDVDTSLYEQLPHVTILREDRKWLQSYYTEMSIVPEKLFELFSSGYGIYPIDVVLNLKIDVGLQISRIINVGLWEEFGKGEIPVVNWEPRGVPKRIASYHDIGEETLIQRAATLCSLRTMYSSKNDLRDDIDGSKDYLSYAMIKRIKDLATVLPSSVDWAGIDAAVQGVQKRSKFTVFYGGKMTGQKRIKFILDVCSKLVASGADMEVLITSQTKGALKLPAVRARMKSGDWLKIRWGTGSQSYWKAGAESSVFFYAGLYDNFSIGVLEMAYLGIPCVLPRTKEFEETFGKDYELFYSPMSEVSAYDKLKWVMEHPAEAAVIGSNTRQLVKAKQAAENEFVSAVDCLKQEYGNKAAMLMEDLKFTPSVVGGRGNLTLLQITVDSLKPRKTVGLYEIAAKLRQFKDRELAPATGGYSLTLWNLYQGLKALGAVDLYDAPVPTMDITGVASIGTEQLRRESLGR
jgi:glycosyltransferase involved in cell wall biosynthesis